jgi:hypothetical protein
MSSPKSGLPILPRTGTVTLAVLPKAKRGSTRGSFSLTRAGTKPLSTANGVANLSYIIYGIYQRPKKFIAVKVQLRMDSVATALSPAPPPLFRSALENLV